MLSYRHGYHAGGQADVLKHSVHAFCLDYLTRKPKPFFAMDTHAGAGIYNLAGDMADRTGEWREGVGRIPDLTDVPEVMRVWAGIVSDLNDPGDVQIYPGSPEIARRLVRAQDRLRLCELHPTDHAVLRDHGTGELAKKDGFEQLVKAMPPKERRGIVLVDPSYEIKDDYDRAAEALVMAHRKFATGVYLLWYPVVERDRTEEMLDRIAVATAASDRLRVEIGHRPDGRDAGMTASGLYVINPPWTLADAAQDALDWMQRVFSLSGNSFVKRFEAGAS